MAAGNITITAGNVLPGANAKITLGIAGATITAGQFVYLDSVTNTYKLADANATAATAAVVGAALQNVGAGQAFQIDTEDDAYQHGGTCTLVAADQQAVFMLSSTAGAMATALVADVGAAAFPVILGVGISATKMKLKILAGGVALS